MAEPYNNNNNEDNNNMNNKPNDNHKSDTNGYNKHNDDNNNNNNDNDTNNDKKNNNNKLELGLLNHHEIENFFMEEEKIEKACNPVSWSNCDATTFNVRRGPNYVAGQKSPSKKALYTAFAMDSYKTPFKINKIFKYINIEKYISKYKVPYNKNKFPLPSLFILNVMVPNYAPELMGGKCDGNGYHIILYAHLSNEIREELTKYSSNPQKYKLSPSVKLLSSFIHSDLVNSEIRNRFKVIARVMNSQYTDFGFLANRLVKRYNGKPFLARTSSTFYHCPGKYFAADIDAHVFGYPARQGLSYVKNSIQTAVYDVGLVIEGHGDNELPEQILACCRISKMGVDLCKSFPSKLMKQYIESTKNPSNQTNDEHKSSSSSTTKSTTNLYDNDDDDDDDDDNNNKLNDNNKPHRNGVQSKSTPSLPNTSTNDNQSGNSNNNDIKQQQTSSQTSLTSKILGGWGYFG